MALEATHKASPTATHSSSSPRWLVNERVVSPARDTEQARDVYLNARLNRVPGPWFSLTGDGGSARAAASTAALKLTVHWLNCIEVPDVTSRPARPEYVLDSLDVRAAAVRRRPGLCGDSLARPLDSVSTLILRPFCLSCHGPAVGSGRHVQAPCGRTCGHALPRQAL